MYQLYLPAMVLQPYIENDWVLKTQSSSDAPIQEAIFVDGRADMLFNFGVSYLRGNPQQALEAITFSNLELSDHVILMRDAFGRDIEARLYDVVATSQQKLLLDDFFTQHLYSY